MEILIIKRKQFEVIEKMGERTFKAIFKGKTYFIRHFPNHDSELDDFIYIGKRISACGILVPKIFRVDRKAGYIAMEYIDGPSVMDDLIRGDLSEDYYKKIFLYAWYAKGNKLALSFKPEHFKFINGKLFYLAFVFHDYSEKTDFNNNGVRLWFYTREFMNYIEEKGFKVDKNRLGDEFSLNKKIVLTACNYYR